MRLVRALLLLPLFASTAPAAEPNPHSAALVERAKEMYGLMLEKNARHYHVRDELAPYFINQEDLAAFMVHLAKDLDDHGIYTNRLEERTVDLASYDEDYGEAQVKVKLEGDWLLWINRSFERTDRWKLINGQWYLKPPPLKNLEYQ